MNLKNMVKFYVPTWSIFAGPVTNALSKLLCTEQTLNNGHFWTS